jgi:predicted phosphodiesterase
MSKKIVSLEDVTEEELRLLQDLKKRSITPEEAQKVLKNADKFYEKKNVVYNLETGTEFEFALIGDTHMGNHHYESSALKEFYRYCAKQGIKNVYHCGDLVDGLHVHPGSEFEQYALGFSEQVKDVVENYPHFKNVKTYFILGNHDLFFYKTAGANIGDLISKEREDMICLGRDEADILIGNGTKLRIAHPGGGSSYATSYRLQKLIESISGGDKPNIYAAGHYHKSLQMTYRNVIGFLVGCFESQTDFMKSKGLSASVGGYIVRGKSGKHGGVKEITVTYIPFFKSN